MHRYVRGGAAVMGSFSSVYNWLAHEILGGSRTPAQVRYYVEEDVLGSSARSQLLLNKDGAGEASCGDSDSPSDDSELNFPESDHSTDDKVSTDSGSSDDDRS